MWEVPVLGTHQTVRWVGRYGGGVVGGRAYCAVEKGTLLAGLQAGCDLKSTGMERPRGLHGIAIC